MAPTALVVCVGEADGRIDDLRQSFDPARALGASAHITVLYPFMPLALRSPKALARITDTLARFPAFDFQLVQVGCFADTAYLAPQPATPFVALTKALAQAFPDFPPYGGEHATVVPHLTVAHGSAELAACVARELKRRLRQGGPIRARCAALSLLCITRGRWREARRFGLAHTPST